MNEQMLKMIDDELKELYKDMRNLDRQYIEKQKRVRELKKAKASLQESSSK